MISAIIALISGSGLLRGVFDLFGGMRGMLAAVAAAAIVLSGASLYDRLWDDPRVAAAARREYVERAKLVAAENELKEIRRQLNAGAQVIEEFRRRAAADEAHDAQVTAENEARIAEYEAKLKTMNRPGLTQEDLDFLRR